MGCFQGYNMGEACQKPACPRLLESQSWAVHICRPGLKPTYKSGQAWAWDSIIPSLLLGRWLAWPGWAPQESHYCPQPKLTWLPQKIKIAIRASETSPSKTFRSFMRHCGRSHLLLDPILKCNIYVLVIHISSSPSSHVPLPPSDLLAFWHSSLLLSHSLQSPMQKQASNSSKEDHSKRGFINRRYWKSEPIIEHHFPRFNLLGW